MNKVENSRTDLKLNLICGCSRKEVAQNAKI